MNIRNLVQLSFHTNTFGKVCDLANLEKLEEIKFGECTFSSESVLRSLSELKNLSTIHLMETNHSQRLAKRVKCGFEASQTLQNSKFEDNTL